MGGQPSDARLYWNLILEPTVDIPHFGASPLGVCSPSWWPGLHCTVVWYSGFQESRAEAGTGMLVPDIHVQFYWLHVCQSCMLFSEFWNCYKNISCNIFTKTRLAFITMMYSTALCTRRQSYPRWIVLTKAKPPTLLRWTDMGIEACGILLSSKKAAELCQRNEEIAEVVSSFQSNSILRMKLLDKVVRCPGHLNLRLILLENVVIDTVSMLQPGATDADVRQAIYNCYIESGVTAETPTKDIPSFTINCLVTFSLLATSTSSLICSSSINSSSVERTSSLHYYYLAFIVLTYY
jgi:hypothetical protein